MNPEVYLLDEPSSALDKETEGIVISTLYTHVKETNKTLIMVSHSTEVADDYSDCIIKMENGSVIDMKEV
ncbi:Arginine transport ATP-binding protein ArtP [bioreactor metagenome]|uniref:Arginine transport ATP-binding protein ArtP n=2 Tax=root TaxID=1 RepID=A0A645ITS9_9ZZZZ